MVEIEKQDANTNRNVWRKAEVQLPSRSPHSEHCNQGAMKRAYREAGLSERNRMTLRSSQNFVNPSFGTLILRNGKEMHILPASSPNTGLYVDL
jgi:hypothetical protein